jgi:hypothetical protein
MLRRRTYERSVMNDQWTSFDPVDGGVIERLFKKEIREGEEGLMLAVLENAIEYFQKYALAQSEREKRLFREAEEWILEKNSDWFFSFENICETLELYPDYIRQGLLRWKEAKYRSVQPPQPERLKSPQPRLLVRIG